MTAANGSLALLLLVCVGGILAWSPAHPSHCNWRSAARQSTTISLAATNDGPDEAPNEKNLAEDKTKEESTAAFGVSYIGGDPCSSRYNDPFDATQEESFKPGLPDDMRDRIAALAAQKAEEMRETSASGLPRSSHSISDPRRQI